MYKNFDLVTGISFLPSNGGVYELAPYEEITEEEYEELIKKLPVIDFSLLSLYEQQDQTQGSREYACGGGTCEL
ncbi:MAG: hypothetical protein KAX49_18390 [Halanaerobiales bacterium]|nr:hypothetical protein [Halanaerobiales bacterium]